MVRKPGLRKSIKKTRGLIAGLTKEPSTAKDFRGFAAEEKAFRAAKYWQKKKLILGVRQTVGLSQEDREMIDLVLTLLDGREVFVEVKDYCNLEIVRKCRERKRILFFIGPAEQEEIAKERMRDLIISAYISLFKLTPFETRQLILKIGEVKELPEPVERPNLFKRFFSRLRKVSS